MAKIKSTFIELTPYYLNDGNANYLHIDIDFKKWLKLIGLTTKEFGKLNDEDYNHYLENDYYAKQVLLESEKYGIYNVYILANEKKFFEDKGIGTELKENTLFLDIPEKHYKTLASNVKFLRIE